MPDDPLPTEAWLHSDQHMLLLGVFVEPHDADQILRFRPELHFDSATYWVTLKAFWKAGLLAPSSLQSRVQTYLDVPSLRRLLAERQLPRTGKKMDMIARLIDADPEGVKAAVPGRWPVSLTADPALRLLMVATLGPGYDAPAG